MKNAGSPLQRNPDRIDETGVMQDDPITNLPLDLRKNQAWVRRLALTLVRCREDAEDVVQETWPPCRTSASGRCCMPAG